MPIDVVSSLPVLSDDELLQTWRWREEEAKASEPRRWESLMKGTFVPETETDRDGVQLREELRKRGLYNVKHLQ